MAKKTKKKFKISRSNLNVKIDEYLEKGGKITKLECIVPEQIKPVISENQRMGSNINVSMDRDFYTRIVGKSTR
mgnify:CR=1 FL=1|jgi:hypothetical protein